eukprot:1045785-Prymnesium_polylepis.1
MSGSTARLYGITVHHTRPWESGNFRGYVLLPDVSGTRLEVGECPLTRHRPQVRHVTHTRTLQRVALGCVVRRVPARVPCSRPPSP